MTMAEEGVDFVGLADKSDGGLHVVGLSDVLGQIRKEGASALQSTIKWAGIPAPIVVSAVGSLSEAFRALSKSDASRAVVVDGDRPVGIMERQA